VLLALLLCAAALCARGDAPGPAPQAGSASSDARAEVVRMMLERSRLLEHTRFDVPSSVYEQYLVETGRRQAEAPTAPTPWILEEAVYSLSLPEKGAATITARIQVRVFHANTNAFFRALPTQLAWKNVQVNEKDAELPTVVQWLVYTPPEPGLYTITAEAPVAAGDEWGGSLRMPIAQTVRTRIAADSSRAWRVTEAGAPAALTGGEAGTHGQLALTTRRELNLHWQRPRRQTQRPATHQLRGEVAWNIDAGRMDVAADITVAILAGRTDRLELTLPAGADRVSITGPDVREARASGGTAVVELRGQVSGRTRLQVEFTLPAAKEKATLSGLNIRGGRWAGGTLVVTNALGGSEVLAGSVSGLSELSLPEIPRAAQALLAGAPALAYAISAPSFTAEAEVLDLGEFALQETIADLAHYQCVFRPDGTVMTKVEYEVRNRNRQFLRVNLPEGARVLQARVNGKTCPASPAGRDAVLAPLVRSAASVKGLVSFPVEIVYLCRVRAPDGRSGRASIPLPRIDAPIAYAWCEAYLPDGMKIAGASGPMRRVERYSSETATASMAYGRSELAEGYEREGRFEPGAGLAAPEPPPEASEPAGEAVGWFDATDGAPFDQKAADEAPTTQPATDIPGGQAGRPQATEHSASGKMGAPQSSFSTARQSLGRNYWRAGKDYYEKGDLLNAEQSLSQVVELAPDTPEADNAAKLLANIRVTRGDAELNTKGEKAAAKKVASEIRSSNQTLIFEQQKALEEGFQAVQEGEMTKALSQLQAAEALTKELEKRGVQSEGQTYSRDLAHKEIRKLQSKRRDEVERLRGEAEELRERGRYTEALQKAMTARDIAGQAGLNEAQVISQRELDELAVRSARQRMQMQQQAIPARTAATPLPPGPVATLPDSDGKREEAVRRGREHLLKLKAKNERLRATLKALEEMEGPSERSDRVSPAQKPTTGNRSETRLIEETEQLLQENARLADRISSAKQDLSALRVREPEEDRLLQQEQPWYEFVRFPDDWNSLAKEPKVSTEDAADQRSLVEGEARPNDGKETKVYDVRDLTILIPDFSGPRLDVNNAGDNAADSRSGEGGGIFGGSDAADGGEGIFGGSDAADGGEGELRERAEVTRTIVQLLRQTLGDRTDVRLSDGRVIVSGNADRQHAAAELIRQLRETRSSNVEFGGNIARQYAAGKIEDSKARSGLARKLPDGGFTVEDTGVDGVGGRLRNDIQVDFQAPAAPSNELARFYRANYDWVWEAAPQRLPAGGGPTPDKMAQQLSRNLGQKAPIASTNLNVDRRAAAALGVRFNAGNNNVRWAVVDEAQFRTLQEMDAANSSHTPLRAERQQEAVIGTDALLANGMTAYLAFGGDRGNALDIRDNPIALPHERYLLIDNGTYITAVRTAPMRHWTESPSYIRFPEAPQTIDLPRVGRMLKFEKTLVKPGDELVLHVQYEWKGDAQ